MKQFIKWWYNQFESKLEMKLWTYPLIILVILCIILTILNKLGVNTIIF